MIAIAPQQTPPESDSWQAGFLAMLPAITRQAQVAFRGFNAEAKEDGVTEVIASAMCAYRRLHERGELQRAFPTALARFAIAQYHAGRRVGSSHRSGDIYARRTRVCSGGGWPHSESESSTGRAWQEALVDNRRTSVPAQVAFRVDFPRWLGRLAPRDRQAAERLSLGYSTREVAGELQLSPGRISQLRRELAESWFSFTNATTDKAQPAQRDPVRNARETIPPTTRSGIFESSAISRADLLKRCNASSGTAWNKK